MPVQLFADDKDEKNDDKSGENKDKNRIDVQDAGAADGNKYQLKGHKAMKLRAGRPAVNQNNSMKWLFLFNLGLLAGIVAVYLFPKYFQSEADSSWFNWE